MPLFLSGEPRWFWTSFPLLSYLSSFTPLSGTLHLLSVFVFQMYHLLFTYLLTLTIFLLSSLSFQVTTILNLNQVKDIPSWNLYDIMLWTWCYALMTYLDHGNTLYHFWFHQLHPYSKRIMAKKGEDLLELFNQLYDQFPPWLTY